MTVVILGAGGRLGTLLRPRWPGGARWLTRSDVDLRDAARLRQAVRDAQAVFCLAGVTPGGAGAMDDNMTVARAVLDAAQAAQAGRVFLFSSAAVYGAQGGPLTEDGPTAPVSDYGRAKLEMEAMARAHPHPATTLRLGNVAGADAILGGWRPGFTLDQLPDGTTPRRSYIGPTRLAHLLHDLAQKTTRPDCLNVAAPGAVEMGALLDQAGLAWTARPATGKTLANVTLDTARLERLTVFHADDSAAAGIVADWKTGDAA